MVRDVTRVPSKTLHPMIFYSSDEIAGCDVVPHESSGQARSMSVLGGKQRLAFALVENMENHTLDVILVNELGNCNEAGRIITARQCRARVITSVHKSIRSALRNPMLRSFLGCIDRAMFSDASCKVDFPHKVRSVRAAKMFLTSL